MKTFKDSQFKVNVLLLLCVVALTVVCILSVTSPLRHGEVSSMHSDGVEQLMNDASEKVLP